MPNPDWNKIIPTLAQKLGYDHLQLWQADLTEKILHGSDVVLTAGTGQGKSTLLLAPLLAQREIEGKAIGLSIAPTKALGEDQVCCSPHYFICLLLTHVIPRPIPPH
jgi:DEAD/DEAH box helicase domain-containing protein